jgi:hypothetical protein
MEYIKERVNGLASLLVILVVVAGLTAVSPDPARAWITCTGNTHYHYNYTIPTKHVNTGTIIWRNGERQKLWEIKKDWDKNGSFQHVEYQATSCEVW